MREINGLVEHRRRCCTQYARTLGENEQLKLPLRDAGLPLYYFPVVVPDKVRLLQEARRQRVEVIAWPTRTPVYPVDRLEDLAAYGYAPGSCPVAERVATRLVGLPTHGRINARERERTVALLSSWSGRA